MKLYSDDNKSDTVKSLDLSPITKKQIHNRDFGYLNSFLYLTYNLILKDQQTDTLKNQYRARAFTVTGYKSLNNQSDSVENQLRYRKFSMHSNRLPEKAELTSTLNSYMSINNLIKEDLYECNMDELKLWKLSVDEALSNTLLMFFAGYETTSSALGFCCHVLIKIPEQRDKLLDEIKDFWSELSFNLESSVKKPKGPSENDDDSSSTAAETSFDDDVFENTDEENDSNRRTRSENIDSTPNQKSFNQKQWNEMYNTLEKMKYLDMFVKEVLRMFPIANSMVSRKCMVDDLYIDNGNYYVPKGMNVVVDGRNFDLILCVYGPKNLIKVTCFTRGPIMIFLFLFQSSKKLI